MGWANVPVRVVDLEEIVAGEFAENAIRKDFLPSEVYAIMQAMADIVATPVGVPPKEIKETFLNKQIGQTRDKPGAFAGVSGRTVEKIAAVVESAMRSLGEMIAEQKETVGLNSGGANHTTPGATNEPGVIDTRPTLADAGIDKKLSSRAQKMAAIPSAYTSGC